MGDEDHYPLYCSLQKLRLLPVPLFMTYAQNVSTYQFGWYGFLKYAPSNRTETDVQYTYSFIQILLTLLDSCQQGLT